MKLDVIGYDCGWGCADYMCEDGPEAIRASSLIYRLNKQNIAVQWRGPLGLKRLGSHAKLTTKEQTLPLLQESLRRLLLKTQESVTLGHIPLVIGGDHSSAIATWSGVVSALGAYQNFGLIWIDAHLDAHTAETSHQGKWGGWWHGQPISALTGRGLPAFTQMGNSQQKLSPAHISIIGPHSFEPAEAEYVARHGIRVYFLDEVKKRGFAEVFAEAKTRVLSASGGFGLSIDLDAFRGEDAPGVGTAEHDGLVAADVLPIIKSIGRHPHFKALEIAEYNPHKDIAYKTGNLLEKLAENIFMKQAA